MTGETTMSKRATAIATVLLALLAGGCGNENTVIRTGNEQLPPNEHSAAFLDRVVDKEDATENDAFRGLLLLLDGEDNLADFEQRVNTLRERGLVDNTWSFRADRPIARGKLAYMLYQALDIPGGVILTLTGPSQRYCLKELQYRGMIAQGAVYSPVSGLELVSVLNRADVYKRTGKVPDMTGRVED
jgi:hypothetical protein